MHTNMDTEILRLNIIDRRTQIAKCHADYLVLLYNTSLLRRLQAQTIPDATPLIGKTSLLRRLQAQLLPNEAPPIRKINPFSKLTVTF